MIPKRIVSIMAVAIMMLTPLACACIDADDGNDMKANAVMVKMKGTSQEGFEAVADTDSTYSGLIDELFIDHKSFSSDFKMEMKISEIDWTDGFKKSYDSYWVKAKEVVESSFRFTITFTALKNDVKLPIYDDMDDYLSGDGFVALKSFIAQSLDKDKTMVISGKYSDKDILGSAYDLYNTSGGKLLSKDMSLEVYRVTHLTDVKYQANGKELSFGKDLTARASTNMGEYKYRTDVDKVKEGDKCDVTYTLGYSVEKNSVTYIVKSDGNEKPMKFDADKYKKDQYKDPTTKEDTVEFEKSDTLNANASLTDLFGLNYELKSKTVDEIKKTIGDKNGSISTDVSEYDNEVSKIEKEVNGSSTNDSKTLVWVAVAVIAILLIAVIAKVFSGKKA